jgi:membrane protease YdiL (CAAX protease family)
MIWFGMLTLMIGFAEEGLVRGVVLHALVSGGVRRAVLLSSLFFGISHVVNILQGASATATIVQIIYATLLGIGFAGMCLYTGTIWPAILLHALIDFVDIASRGFVLTPPRSLSLAGVIAPIVLTSLFALYGWWLLRRTAMSSSAA